MESKCLKHITRLDETKQHNQKVLRIMQFGDIIQLVNQEYWFDKEAKEFKPGKLKGLNISDLEKLNEIGLDKIVKYMKSH